MEQLLSHISLTFESNGWAFANVEGADVIEAGFEAHHGRVRLHVQGFPPLNAVSVVSQSPIRAENADHRVKIVELLMRANHELTVGAFELDWDTGQTIFRATNLFSRGKFDSSILTGLVESAIVEMDRLAPVLDLIAKADRSELPELDVQQLLGREDLLPPVGD
ncbi:MAG: hypothetical protein ACI8UO_002901 [Verrucomicrobiales bacterium]|jgi:hypothetical protein